MTKFSSPFRGLFISTRKSSISSMKQIGFRPLSGVSLFLHIVECSVDLTSVFSSPFRGLFISTEIIMQRLSFAEPSFRPLSGVSLFLRRGVLKKQKYASFRPLSGVSLFLRLHNMRCSWRISFRPLSGVSLFLQRINQCEALTHMFSSPFRGLFISTIEKICQIEAAFSFRPLSGVSLFLLSFDAWRRMRD